MSTKWTKEQEQAISLRNRNLLVSAAAGSGKTAVLVERIVSMLLDKEKPIDVENLLVVTFTEAAAAQMKERVRAAIEQYLEDDSDNEHLRRQSVLIVHGNISTIHGFCLDVIRNHFHVVNIEPSFRIGEQGELKLIRQDVMDELLEERYGREDNQDFLDFVEKFGGGRNDKGIESKILKLYDYSMSTPNPNSWLDDSIINYQGNFNKVEEASFSSLLFQQVNQYLDDGIYYLKQGIQLSLESDGPHMYLPMLEYDLDFLEKIRGLEAFDEREQSINTYSPMRLSSKKDEGVSPDKRETVKEIRKKVKDKIILKLQKEFFGETCSEYLMELANCQKEAMVLIDLVKEFSISFAKAKERINILDFSDMEHLALRILTTEKDGKPQPSPIAKEYQNKFHEIMIDEYQDSNLIQEAILTTVSRCGEEKNNIFMVGDIKQSIYRFRLSVPELFMEKYDTYTDEESNKQRIVLHKNFRSRPQVLNSVNEIFKGIMQKNVGGIVYDEKVALYPGAIFKELEPSFHHDTELLLCGELEEGEPSVISTRIKELLETGQVIDEDTKEFRQIKYKDIVILLRSIKGHGEKLATYLTDNGIPVHFGSQEGYFDAYEVSVLLDYLRVINNGRQDIPLTAVLTSHFVGLSSGELAMIKEAFPKQPFWQGVWEYGGQFGESDCICQKHQSRLLLGKKLTKFYQEIGRYREMLPYLGIHDLLWKIIEETGYGYAVQGMTSGNQRKANLDMLIEKAAAFEKTSYKGVFHFIRYIEELKKYEVEFGEASILDEQSDVVRIMSIHKSKGLEFPVVILAGLSKLFNTGDLRADLMIHPFLGIGLNDVDLERRTVTPTILKNVIKNQLLVENLGEELRVLYVAMTRAKEKLIMVGNLKEKDFLTLQDEIREDRLLNSIAMDKAEEAKILNEVAMDDVREVEVQRNTTAIEQPKDGISLILEKNKLRFFEIITARSYMDWVLPMVLMENFNAPIKIRLFSSDDIKEREVIEATKEGLSLEALLNWNKEQVFNKELREQFLSQLNYHYPHENVEEMKLKFTVSELKKRGVLRDDLGEPLIKELPIIPLLPKFIDKIEGTGYKTTEELTEKVTGATRGTAYHLFMENLDFEKEYSHSKLDELKHHLVKEGKMEEESVTLVDNESIIAFLKTDLAKRMKKAKKADSIYEEQPFVMNVDACNVYPEEIKEGEETILIQGIIDLWFEEDGEIVLVDYKTDRVKDSKELLRRYATQLKFYGQALEGLTGKKVKDKIIYSFYLHEEIEVVL